MSTRPDKKPKLPASTTPQDSVPKHGPGPPPTGLGFGTPGSAIGKHGPEIDPESGGARRKLPKDFVFYEQLPVDHEPSWGVMDERHWSRSRGDRNAEVIEYYRQRSHAPGVAEGGGLRNSYCLECDGVIPLQYFQTEPVDSKAPLKTCPHCGVKLDRRVQRMFNWVEIDRPHDGDFKAILPLLLGGLLLIGLVIAWLISIFF